MDALFHLIRWFVLYENAPPIISYESLIPLFVCLWAELVFFYLSKDLQLRLRKKYFSIFFFKNCFF